MCVDLDGGCFFSSKVGYIFWSLLKLFLQEDVTDVTDVSAGLCDICQLCVCSVK